MDVTEKVRRDFASLKFEKAVLPGLDLSEEDKVKITKSMKRAKNKEKGKEGKDVLPR